VTEAAQLGSDGGLARYRLVMAPWLAALQLRRDSFVFQDKTVQQILDEVFADYPRPVALGPGEPEALRTRSLCIQYRESDWAFVQRLLASEGLSWHIEHLGDEDAATADEQGKARHVMVITDAGAERADLGPSALPPCTPPRWMAWKTRSPALPPSAPCPQRRGPGQLELPQLAGAAPSWPARWTWGKCPGWSSTTAAGRIALRTPRPPSAPPAWPWARWSCRPSALPARAAPGCCVRARSSS
jgi:type VI secretion system secreted protein VgrG